MTTIFDDYENYNFEETKKYLLDDGIYTENELSDELVYDIINDYIRTDIDELNRIDGDFIATGFYTSFYGMGNGKGGKILRNTGLGDALYSISKYCDYHKLYYSDKRKNLQFSVSHHDGNTSGEIRKLTGPGLQLLEKWEDGLLDYTREEINDKIMASSYYSKRIAFEDFWK